ncbi:hypothetical protein Ddye_000703, partial [Dipteronia dyeriana]
AGTEGFDFAQSSMACNSCGRYEIALLCLGMIHFHFGHPKQALEVSMRKGPDGFQFMQRSNDNCLAYTLSAICNFLSEIGISTATGILGSSYSPITSIANSLSVLQQLFVLLKESSRRAESLKLKRLVASNHLAMAKFDLMHVQKPLLSFGPKNSMNLKTCPTNVCKVTLAFVIPVLFRWSVSFGRFLHKAYAFYGEEIDRRSSSTIWPRLGDPSSPPASGHLICFGRFFGFAILRVVGSLAVVCCLPMTFWWLWRRHMKET